ncbi:hypothetical protein L596_024749 [Steinernema carpocapsae]|uniref:Serpin domain-containing protein n=1 Tax=Steinernema carpocapsae TaxID=34508 RepID=A0A4U5M5M9_STECR|nr:hypothetical protein L596_024749 [Steinernema carpocapsae]
MHPFLTVSLISCCSKCSFRNAPQNVSLFSDTPRQHHPSVSVPEAPITRRGVIPQNVLIAFSASSTSPSVFPNSTAADVRLPHVEEEIATVDHSPEMPPSRRCPQQPSSALFVTAYKRWILWQADFAMHSVRSAAIEGDSNMSLSTPLALSACLAMLYLGAEGESKEELAQIEAPVCEKSAELFQQKGEPRQQRSELDGVAYEEMRDLRSILGCFERAIVLSAKLRAFRCPRRFRCGSSPKKPCFG